MLNESVPPTTYPRLPPGIRFAPSPDSSVRRSPRPTSALDEITDADADAYLPGYDRKHDEYPARRSQAHDKREKADKMRARGSLDSVLGEVLHDGMVYRGTSYQVSLTRMKEGQRVEAILRAWDLSPELEEILRYRIYDGLNLEQIAKRMGITKQAVDRRLDILQRKWCETVLDERRECRFLGAESLLFEESMKTLKFRLDNSGGVRRAAACGCGCEKFSQTSDGVNIAYACDFCGHEYDEDAFVRMSRRK